MWIAFATSSLPVPLSPFTSTVELVGAIERIRSNTRFMEGEPPTMRSSPCCACSSAFRRRFSSSRCRLWSALRTTIFSSSMSKGLIR